MRIDWVVDQRDINTVTEFVNDLMNHDFVQERERVNLAVNRRMPERDEIWYTLVGCLLTTLQPSGPNSTVSRFLQQNPFPLNYHTCLINRDNLHNYCIGILTQFGGICRYNRIADEIAFNLESLENGLWDILIQNLQLLTNNDQAFNERNIAALIASKLRGFGPKQSRNFLQDLGLTKYEIPIDSRVIKWLNNFGFPVKLSSTALADINFYNFISDGIQRLCLQCNIYPCILDAAIFASYDE